MIIVVANQKGGVGKTTTAAALAVGLHRLGCRVLSVDLDPQASLTTSLGMTQAEATQRPNLLGVLMGDVAAGDAPVQTEAGVWLVPTTHELAVAEEAMRARPDRERQVSRALAPIVGNYDVVVVDTPPSLGLWVWSGMAMADRILAPVQTEAAAVDGVARLNATLADVRRYGLNERATLSGVALTMYDGRRGIDRRSVDLMREWMGDTVFQTVIPRDVRLAELAETGDTSILDRDTPGATAYRELCDEVMDRWLRGGSQRA